MASKHSIGYVKLIEQLVEERTTGRCSDRSYVNAAMQWGVDHEDAARRWYGRSRSCRIQEVWFVLHSDYDYVGVSPDGLVDDEGLIEIKCPQMKAFNRVMRSSEIPARYRWQVQGQLWVCRREWLDFVCFYPPSRGMTIRVARDENNFDRLEQRCCEINHEVERRCGKTWRSSAAVGTSSTPVPLADEADGVERMRMVRESAKDQGSALSVWVWVILALVALWILGR